MNKEKCWSCSSSNTAVDSCGKFKYKWKYYEYSVIICDDCLSWTLEGDMPDLAKEELLIELEKEFSKE